MIILFSIEILLFIIVLFWMILRLFKQFQLFWLKKKFKEDHVFQKKLALYQVNVRQKDRDYQQIFFLILFFAFAFGWIIFWQNTQLINERMNKIDSNNNRLSQQLNQLKKEQPLPHYPEKGLEMDSLPWNEAVDSQPKTEKKLTSLLNFKLKHYFGSAFPQSFFLSDAESLEVTFPLTTTLSITNKQALMKNVASFLKELNGISSLSEVTLRWQLNHIQIQNTYLRNHTDDHFVLKE